MYTQDGGPLSMGPLLLLPLLLPHHLHAILLRLPDLNALAPWLAVLVLLCPHGGQVGLGRRGYTILRKGGEGGLHVCLRLGAWPAGAGPAL
jgi:hypothetical protein